MKKYFKPKYSIYNCLSVYGDIQYQPIVKYWFWPWSFDLGQIWYNPEQAKNFLVKFTEEVKYK